MALGDADGVADGDTEGFALGLEEGVSDGKVDGMGVTLKELVACNNRSQ